MSGCRLDVSNHLNRPPTTFCLPTPRVRRTNFHPRPRPHPAPCYSRVPERRHPYWTSRFRYPASPIRPRRCTPSCTHHSNSTELSRSSKHALPRS
ncbi:hypothetical protein BU23DRAFT_323742 [Bimuria novae-zelandiae CBS 107.79]|uniref:Uncharacterized protein n=1 Tax=Bimuria novae-zelandiae CBS 107.79 TaxID=1447943 RepID=A0A6A5VNJ6_9PLEO|nr:hypothetical protein BU23DRAFT_323742 [Bimuria novae-zelandiae CBS 107.79]